MEKLARSKNTPGTDAAFDLLGRVAVDSDADERYPNETALVPADSPNASKLMSRAVAERKPVAIVFADGSDVVWRPPAATGPALLLSTCLPVARRSHPTEARSADFRPARVGH